MGSQLDDSDGSRAEATQRVLGYLNFSSGAHDAQFFHALRDLFQRESNKATDQPTWITVWQNLRSELATLEETSPTFADATQARKIIDLMMKFCPAYLEHHSELLAHQTDEDIFNSHFTGRMVESLLAVDSGDEQERIKLALANLNDYVGYRPVATLSSKKIEPYPHEWIRPIPIYVAEVGAAEGKYRAVVEQCVKLLDETDPSLLRAAYFIPSHLDELAIDPRAYDFDHPASKRPNHQFGLWDPHCIDGSGYYRRFVVQQLTIDCLSKRITEPSNLPQEELLIEAAAVMAGTVLMSSGISGYGPETHDSTISLGNLLMSIAAYRDQFYHQLIERIEGTHGARLREEAKRLQQPFGGARQALNRELTQCRAIQLQRVHLARVYARMDYADAADEQTTLIQVPSARLNCEIDCGLTEAKRAIREDDLETSVDALTRTRDRIHRGVQCGAIVDPWNILGFDANFSLFGQIENSIRDFRIDDLVVAVEEMVEMYAQLWSKAVATEQTELAEKTKSQFDEFSNWWHQFAAHEIDSVDAENPLEVFEAASNVVEALKAWQQQGEATGDIGFWAPHVQKFDSCRAYWLVVNTLLLRDDKVASLGLMMHWLSQADHIPLEHGETSFFQLSLRWLAATFKETGTVPNGERIGWLRIRRFFDYLEANAGEFWEVPEFSVEDSNESKPEELATPEGEAEEEEEEELFSAAYENVVYRDSTDDGMEGSVFDFDTSSNEDYLQQMSRTIVEHMGFLDQLATIWKMVAVIWTTAESRKDPDAIDKEVSESIHDLLRGALNHQQKIAKDLDRLMHSVQQYRLSRSGTDPESMVEYDRLRLTKESLLDQIITANVSVVESLQFLSAATDVEVWKDDKTRSVPVDLLQACVRGKPDVAKKVWAKLLVAWSKEPILYVPLNRGGVPQNIVHVKSRQQLIQNLMLWLPRLGLLTETFELVELVRQMEATPVGAGAITEFDNLFEVACRALVNALIDSKEASEAEGENNDEWLVTCVEGMMEPLLRSWLDHSRTLRLSVLEQVMDDEPWEELVKFIREFGRDIFTQRFLNLGNIRGILHQGVDEWLGQLLEYGDHDQYQVLLDALENGLDREEVEDKLTFILEAVVESYSEYRDYNGTTTQSDQGDMLYSLLDFLRLRVSYDRVVWNLNPVIVAHQVLAERGCEDAAQMWRNSLQQRIGAESKRHMERLQELQKKYAMTLPSVAKRLSERFMRPLLIDHICSLIGPATLDADADVRQATFERIKEQANVFLDEPSGAGLEVPAWLMAMEDTIRNIHLESNSALQELMEQRMEPSVILSVEQVQEHFGKWTNRDS